MDWLANVLLSADYNREYDEDNSRVKMIQSVNPVVIIAALQPGVSSEASQDAI